MGMQNEFPIETSSADDVERPVRSTQTLNYVTDLLGELQTISNLSGLSELSEDLIALISKHVSASAKAA